MKAGCPEWRKEQLWERWQVVRRYPPYRLFCERNASAFDSEGMWNGLITREVESLMERCGIDIIQHYEVDDCPPFQREKAIEYVCDFVVSPGDPLHRHEEISFLWNTRSLRKKVRLDNSLGLSRDENDDSNGAEADRQFIVLRVDISPEITLSQLQGEFMDLVDEARYLADIRSPRKGSSLDRETLQVWDLHSLGKSPREIIRELWPDEFEKHETYKCLKRKYKRQGHRDCDERARREAYGLSLDCGIVRKNVAVREKLEQMQRLFKKYIHDPLTFETSKSK